MPTRSDKPSTRKSSTNAKKRTSVKTDPATQPEANADEVLTKTSLPEVVRTKLTQESVSGEKDRSRWISVRAYEIAQARGFRPGNELDDWLQAEREYQARSRPQKRPEGQLTN